METIYFTANRLFLFVLFVVCQLTGWGQTIITFRPGPETGQDCEIRTDFPTTPIGYSTSFCSDAWTVSGEFVIIRSLIRFDLSSIPQDAIILSASLSLFCNPASSHYQLQSGDNESYLMRALEHWDQDVVTWNTQPATTMNQAIYLPTSTFNTQSYPDIDVTWHIQDMVANPEVNFGWMLKLLTEELYRSMEFSSSNDPDTTFRPLLKVVIQCPLPVAQFSYEVQSPTVSFTDLSSSATGWFWDFGDGYQSTLQHPEHTYQQTGNYLVCLTVADSCGSDTVCETVSVCDPMNPDFGFLQESHFVTYTDLSIGAGSWYWDFGDLNYSSQQNPVHYYEEFGTYIVCLLTTNACYSEEYCDTVELIPSAIDEGIQHRLTISPNPCSSSTTITYELISPQKVRIEMYNPFGNLVEIFEEYQSSGIQQFTWYPKNLPDGMYFIRLQAGGKVATGKVVVIKM